jgi:hypothetical protein
MYLGTGCHKELTLTKHLHSFSQNAQQLAMASTILNAAAGYQQAYLQAAAVAAQSAVAGKPLASMLSSMAMLQQVSIS